MKRLFLCLASVALLLPTPAPLTVGGASLAAETAFPPGDVVVFVGHQTVDLMWDAVSGAESYRLDRDPGLDVTISPESVAGRLFYRDSQPSGTDLSYRVCAVYTDSEDCSAWQMAHVGQVQGQLYQDLTWSGITVYLDGLLQVMDGVTLRITGGASVSPDVGPSGDPTIATTSAGHLLVGAYGAQSPTLTGIGVAINDEQHLSEIKGEVGTLVTLDQVQVHLSAPTEIAYANVTNSSVRVDAPSSATTPVKLSYSQLAGSWTSILVVEGQADVSYNTFDGCSDCVRLREGSEAWIEHNVFQPTIVSDGVDIAGATATIRNNQFRHEGWSEDHRSAAVRVWPGTGGQVTISNNTFTGGGSEGAGIELCADPSDPAPPAGGAGRPSVTVEANIFRALVAGLSICEQVTAEVHSNSFSSNNVAVVVSSETIEPGFVIAHDNCIAGNFVGMVAPGAVDARENWWGSFVGPRTSHDLPNWAGDLLQGDAPHRPWLREDNCAPQVRDLRICNIEVTQAIQTYDNAVPLVAGKAALVRVYPGSATGELDGISGELTVQRGAELLGILPAERSVSTLYYPGQCPSATENGGLRSQLGSSLNFKLPADWMDGSLTLSARINPDGAIAEGDETNNSRVITVTLQQQRPVRLGIVPVNLPTSQSQSVQSTGGTAAADPASLLPVSTLFRKIYPGDAITYTILPSIDWPYGLPEPSYDADSGKQGSLLLNTLGLAQQRLRGEGGWEGQAIDQVYGVVAAGTIEHSRSEPTIFGGRGMAAYSMDDPVVFANALGLNLGRVGECYMDFIGDWGYDLTTHTLMPIQTRNALCVPEDVGGLGPLPLDPNQFWAGIDEYQQLLDHNQAAATAGQLGTMADAPQTYVLVGGVVNKVGEVSFMPAWQVTAASVPLNPPAGSTYCLELRDGAETVLASHCFDLPWPTEHWKRWQGFQIGLPLADTPSGVVLRTGSTELGRIPVSANAPSVSIGESSVTALSTDGTLPLSWTAQDGDGDDLVYSVFYSADDGTSWLPVATNLTETDYTLDLAQVPGGTEVWVRVDVSDGFHTASDTLGPFTVDDHSPLVAIAQPTANSVVSPTLTLLGYGYDYEDGELAGTALVWTSDREGQLGTGPMVTVQDLVTGTHRLTLTATDAQGYTASTSVRVGVETPVEPDDGLRIYLPLVLRR